MRIFGRPIGKMHRYAEAKAPELEDFELVADAATLRRLALFLEHAASRMENEGARFEHVHLLDVWRAHGTGTPDIVISLEK